MANSASPSAPRAASPSAASTARNVAFLFAVGITWGLQPAFIKLLMQSGLSEPAALGMMLACVAAILGGTLSLAGQMPSFRSRRLLTFVAINGLAEYAIPLLTAFIVARRIDAGLLTLIIATTPIFTVALASLLGTEPANGRTVLACALGVLAMALIVVPEHALPSRDMLPWCLAALAIPMSYALGSIYVSSNWPENWNAIGVAFSGALVGGLVLTPAWLPAVLGGTMIAGPENQTFLIAFALLVTVTILEMGAYYYLLANAGAVFTSFSSFVMIASGFVAGALLFGETPSAWIWASVALFSASLALIITGR
jgi:drug/metabolite transporter (DMT)-like permease